MLNPKLNTELISYDWLRVDECQVIQRNPNINMAKGEEQSVTGKHSPEQTRCTMTLQQEMSFYKHFFKKNLTVLFLEFLKKKNNPRDF